MTARQTAKHSATVIVGSPIILQCVKAGASLGRTAGALRVTLHQNFTPPDVTITTYPGNAHIAVTADGVDAMNQPTSTDYTYQGITGLVMFPAALIIL
jgi:hypothetical protein